MAPTRYGAASMHGTVVRTRHDGCRVTMQAYALPRHASHLVVIADAWRALWQDQAHSTTKDLARESATISAEATRTWRLQWRGVMSPSSDGVRCCSTCGDRGVYGSWRGLAPPSSNKQPHQTRTYGSRKGALTGCTAQEILSSD